MHPVIADILRWRVGAPVRESVQRGWQQRLRDEVQPLLDERDRLEAELAALTDPQPRERGRRTA